MSWGGGVVGSFMMNRSCNVMRRFMVSLSFVMNRGNGMVWSIMVNLSSSFVSLLNHMLLKLSMHRCFVMNFSSMVGRSIFRCIVRRSLMSLLNQLSEMGLLSVVRRFMMSWGSGVVGSFVVNWGCSVVGLLSVVGMFNVVENLYVLCDLGELGVLVTKLRDECLTVY